MVQARPVRHLQAERQRGVPGQVAGRGEGRGRRVSSRQDHARPARLRPRVAQRVARIRVAARAGQGPRGALRDARLVRAGIRRRCWAQTNRTLDIPFDEGVDRPGPVPTSFVIWEVKEEGEASDTRIIAFTDADFLTDVYINQYSNAGMGRNIVNWLSEPD